MWARKRIDISATELLAAFGYCLTVSNREQHETRIVDCFHSDQLMACLSVRSGFDLALEKLDWPTGSEIIFSGYTIPDMPRIARAHGLDPVGIDVDWKTLTPSRQAIEAAITPNTRAILVVHLMGGTCDLNEIVKLAKKHNLMLIEDCAQAYLGNHYQGSQQADISMFSFGPIKTNTALGGAVLFVRNPDLMTGMRKLHESWPCQTQSEFAKRVLKYGLLKAISCRPVAAMIRIAFQCLGSNHDEFATRQAHSFSGKDFFARIRKQPSSALLRLLARKIGSFSEQRLSRRRYLGNRLARLLCYRPSELPHVGIHMIDPTHWVFALLVDDPGALAQHLWIRGFDATTHSSLVPVVPNTSFHASLPMIEAIHRHIIFVPLDVSMPESEVDRLAESICQTNARLPELFALDLQPLNRKNERSQEFAKS